MAAQYEAIVSACTRAFAARNGSTLRTCCRPATPGLKRVFEREYAGSSAFFGAVPRSRRTTLLTVTTRPRWETTINHGQVVRRDGLLHVADDAARSSGVSVTPDSISKIDHHRGRETIYKHGLWATAAPA